MVKYMEEAEKSKSGYSKTPYNLYNHNCGVYGVSTINQAMPWYRKATGTVFNLIPGALNAILGGIVGIGHDIEQGKIGTNTIQGLTNFTGAGEGQILTIGHYLGAKLKEQINEIKITIIVVINNYFLLCRL